jgi:hypothetical protein
MQQINVIVTPKAKQTISVTVNGVAMSVVNSDGSYSTTHYSGTPFIIPDTIIKNTAGATILTQPSATSTGVIADSVVTNSDNTFSLNVPAETTHNLPDITITKNDGSTYSYPAAKDLTETKSASIYTLFPTTYDMNYSHVVTAKEAGVYTTETLVNVATVEYKVNTVVKTLPITLVAGDVLLRTIAQTNAAIDSSVEIYY